MSKSRFSDPYNCIQCGEEVSGDDDFDDGDTRWINEEPSGYLYPGYPGDPVCVECYLLGPSVSSRPDTVEEAND